MACYGESLLTDFSSSLLAGAFHHDDNFVTEQASFLHTKLPLALTRDSQSHPGAMNEQQKGPGESALPGPLTVVLPSILQAGRVVFRLLHISRRVSILRAQAGISYSACQQETTHPTFRVPCLP